jgi:hypothetical protein
MAANSTPFPTTMPPPSGGGDAWISLVLPWLLRLLLPRRASARLLPEATRSRTASWPCGAQTQELV